MDFNSLIDAVPVLIDAVDAVIQQFQDWDKRGILTPDQQKALEKAVAARAKTADAALDEAYQDAEREIEADHLQKEQEAVADEWRNVSGHGRK